MNCGVPEADKDPFEDEPIEVSSGQFDEDGNDVRRIPPGLVCSDQDRIVGGEFLSVESKLTADRHSPRSSDYDFEDGKVLTYILGLDAHKNSWPWIVMLSYKYFGNSYQFQCSGTLINEDTIITAWI